MNLTSTAPITVPDLEAHGFTADEITRLQQLKACYNRDREYFENNAVYERLSFLKWRYQQGEMMETITG